MEYYKYSKFGSRYIIFTSLLAGLLLTLALGGCSYTNATRIDVKDNRVALPEVRMAINFDHVKEAASFHTGNAIELGSKTGSGSDSQSLNSGQYPILIGEQSFTAPQQLRNDIAFTYNEILWRTRILTNKSNRDAPINLDGFGVELSVGLGETSVDLKVSSNTLVATRQFKVSGIRLGGGFYYPLSPGSGLQLKGTFFRSMTINMNLAELVYAKTFFNNFRLRAGIAGGNILGYEDRKSDYSFEFFGPILALDLEF